MSLTGQLSQSGTAMNSWWSKHQTDKVMKFLNEHNNRFSKIVPATVMGHSEYEFIGTAFGRYMFPWVLGDIDANETFAIEAAKSLNRTNVVEAITQYGNLHPDHRPICSMILAEFEVFSRRSASFGRYGNGILTNTDAIKGDPRNLIKTMLRSIESQRSAVLKDVQLLTRMISEKPTPKIMRRIVCPTFDGSDDVGGADAKMIVNHSLLDAVCSQQRKPFTIQNLQKVISYALLDYSDHYEIHALSWYMARQGVSIKLRLEVACSEFLNMTPEEARNDLKTFLRKGDESKRSNHSMFDPRFLG